MPCAPSHLPTPATHLLYAFADRNERHEQHKYRMGEAADYEIMFAEVAAEEQQAQMVAEKERRDVATQEEGRYAALPANDFQ